MASGYAMPTFDINDPVDLHARWTRWLKRFERILDDSQPLNDAQKINKLFLAGGMELEEKNETLVDGEYATSYKDVTAKITEYCAPNELSHIKLMELRSTFQHEQEPFDEFLNRLKNIANQCNLGDKKNEEIKTVIIHNCRSMELRKEALRKSSEHIKTKKTEIPLEVIVELGRSEEAIMNQCKFIERKKAAEDDKAEIYKLESKNKTYRI